MIPRDYRREPESGPQRRQTLHRLSPPIPPAADPSGRVLPALTVPDPLQWTTLPEARQTGRYNHWTHIVIPGWSLTAGAAEYAAARGHLHNAGAYRRHLRPVE